MLIPEGQTISGKNCATYDLFQMPYQQGDQLELQINLLSWDTGPNNPDYNPGDCLNTLTCNARTGSKCSRDYTIDVIPKIPGIAIQKSANRASATVGDVITYVYNVTNDGSINLTGIVASDSRGLVLTLDNSPENSDGYLNLTDIWNYTAVYTVTEEDLCDNITNTASVQANPLCPGGAYITDNSEQINVTTYYDANLAINKTADKSSVTVGDTITYTYNVTNEGNVNLCNIDIQDDLVPTVTYVSGDTSGEGCLNLTETWKFTGSYLVTQSDICDDISNTATVTADDPCGGTALENSTSLSILTTYDANLAINKTADKSSVTVGDTITYTYNVTNEGNVNLCNIDIQDDLVPTVTYVSGDTSGEGCLNLTETWKFTGSYLATQSDICDDISNTATVTADDPCGGTALENSTSLSILTTYDANLAINKTADKSSVTVGDTITYTYNVTNEGNVNLCNIDIQDDLVPTVTYVSGDTSGEGCLNLTETWKFTGSYLATQSDICDDISNTATVTADDPCGGTALENSTSLSILTTYDANLAINKTADKSSVTVGDTITYTYNVTNEGNVNLCNIDIQDDLVPTVTYVSGDTSGEGCLNLTETWKFTGSYLVTQSDICDDISNTATVTADDPCGGTALENSTSLSILTTYDANLAINKTADKSSVTVGDTITYTYNVTNEGNVNLCNIDIQDDLVPTVTYVSGDTSGEGCLNLTETWKFTGSYLVTQSDICDDISNTATVTADDPCGGTALENSTSLSILTTYDANLAINKTADKSSVTVGDTITYTYNVTNEGNVNLCNIDIQDDLVPTVTYVSGDTSGEGCLNLTETWKFTGSYLVTQSDICDDISNTATVTADDPCGGTALENSTSLSILTTYDANLAINKTADKSSVTVGDTITYTYNVTNEGNVNLCNIDIQDDLVPTVTYVSGDTSGEGCLNLTETWKFTGSYLVTQSDICDDISNTATVTADDPCGGTALENSTSLSILTTYDANLAINKTADKSSVTVGDTITYTYNVTNEGNVNLCNIDIQDDLVPTVTYVSGDTSGEGCLNLTETWKFTGSYLVTQSDICDDISNTATVTADDPCGGTALENSTSLSILTTYDANLAINKTADKSSVTVGDTITYTYNVTNEGNVNLCNIDIQDDLVPTVTYVSGDTSGEGCLNLTETWKFTGSYLVTQSDICDDISNTATVTADDPCGGTALENSTSLSILTTYDANLAINKTADKSSVTVGDTITYTYNVTNEGNVNLCNIDIQDDLVPTVTYVSGDTSGEGCLNLTETWKFTGSYLVTQSDICDDISNTATVTADDPCGGTALENSTSLSILTTYDANLAINKTADKSSVTVGDTITYTYNVTNEGNVNLCNIDIQDDLVPTVTYVSGDTSGEGCLNLTETWKFTGSYLVTQSDICDDISNTATVTADDPCGGTALENSTSLSILTTYDANLAINKTADKSSVTVGDTITYTYNVTNEGNVNLCNIDIQDDLVPTVTYVSGDTSGEGFLNLTETWKFTGS